MEKYSKHLESIVAERTQEMFAEKEKADKLLYSECVEATGRLLLVQVAATGRLLLVQLVTGLAASAGSDMERLDERCSACRQREKSVLPAGMIPKAVADELKQGKPIQAEQYSSCSVYFSDIVGFTALSGQSHAVQV